MALDDRYTASDGVVYLSGNQALVRLLLEQRRRDERAGIRTGIFVTGYPGSPLGGFDLALGRARAHAQAAGVVHLPGQNEELAATTLMGTQMIDDHPHPDVDGVVGYWYGKGPGLDRATDALKHGNFAGTSRTGAVVILSGEDHEAKSSTVPYEQEAWFEHTGIPLLYPSSVAQFIEFGLHAAALSRYSGCYVGMKLVGALCDGGETVRLSATTPQIRTPELAIGGRPFRKRTNFMFSPGLNLETEKELYGERHVAVRAYARLNALDRIEVRTAADRVGIVASGKSFVDVRQALRDLGLDDDALNVRGIRLMRVGMLYPADGDRIREFGAGLDEVIVVEEKRDFLERQVGRALRDLPERVRIIGKTDDRGAPAFPMYGGFDGDLVAEVLASRLARRFELPAAAATRLAALRTIRDRSDAPTHRRSPNYCSGCPHNVSTKLLPDQIAWGAPGCHIFASMMEQPERRIEAVTQYGGEGLPWLGLAPFVTRRHIVQNVGDGSLFHSSYLNIRFAVHAGANITFKILYNGAIANTGGQVPAGALPVEKLVTLLATEGVARIDVIAVEPRAYAGVPLPRSVRVRPVAELARSLAELEQTGGVTVQLYDGTCSNERRRRQKRGTAPAPAEFVVINEDVCENCGDCGALTNCMSLQKVETEFGPKTQVHQSSCNQDRSCLGGDCPSFVSVRTKPGSGIRRPAPARIDATIPEPVPSARLDEPYHISIPGVGGTGVITLNAILAQAAALDGHRVSTYDQTGAAQKWGQVLSNVIVAEADGIIESNRTGLGRADLYLALDLMAAADSTNLARCDRQRTAAVVVTDVLPSGDMIRDVRVLVPPDPLIDAVAAQTDRSRSVLVPARTIAEAAFGDHMMTNMVALGAAFQAGLLPISGPSIEAAIRLNGVEIETNLRAFWFGRLSQHDPAAVRELTAGPYGSLAERQVDTARDTAAGVGQRVDARIATIGPLPAAVLAKLRVRAADLVAYGGSNYAERYVDFVRRTADRERAAAPGSEHAVTAAVVDGLHKLMAYKDEYEVARLHTQTAFAQRARSRFEQPQRIVYHLHPPMLRALGLKRKLRFGGWFTPVLRTLAAAKGVRGTPFDIFGYAKIRREERRLVGWYRELVETSLARLNPATAPMVASIARIPDDIRGYESIKLRSIVAAEVHARELLESLPS